MIKFLLALLLVFAFGGEAVAQSAPPSYLATPMYKLCVTVAPCNVYVETKAQACTNWANASTASNAHLTPPVTYSVSSAGADRCNVVASTGQTDSREYSVAYACPNGGTVQPGMPPMCGNIPPPDSSQCSDKNPIIRKYSYGPAGPYTAPVNFGSCKVSVIEMLTCHKDSGGSFCYWKIARTGELYTGSQLPASGASSNDPSSMPPSTPTVPSPPLSPPPPVSSDVCKTCVPCPRGTVQAGVGPDGVPMCVGTGTNPPPPPVPPPTTTKPPVTTTAADGSSVVKQDSVQSNRDGSTTTTTTTTTTAPDGSKTVSVSSNTTMTSAGAPGSTDKNPQDEKYDMCKSNPTLSICRESSVSGSCGAISCVGDAIQCSTLRAAAAMQCKQAEDEAALKALPSKSLGDAIISGSDPAQAEIANMLKGTDVDLSKPNLDQGGFLAGGSCFPNKSFTAMGKTVTIDFIGICNNIQPLRNVILACAYIAAYLIVSRSVLSS